MKDTDENLFNHRMEIVQLSLDEKGLVMSRKETLGLGGMAFCSLMDDLILLGRDRDLVVYDRLTHQDLLVIPNASFTGLWKDIVQLQGYPSLEMPRVFLTLDNERIALVSINLKSQLRKKYERVAMKHMLLRQDGYELASEYTRLRVV